VAAPRRRLWRLGAKAALQRSAPLVKRLSPLVVRPEGLAAPRATKPLDWGWYAVVSTCWIPRRRRALFHVPEVNCVPLSVVIVAGRPNLAIHELMTASRQAAAAVERSGTASAHRVDRSTIVRRWL
jgi:hypothetical protein